VNNIMWLFPDAPPSHVVGTVRATLRTPDVRNNSITYTVLPGSIRAVNKFNYPVTAATSTHDYRVRCGMCS